MENLKIHNLQESIVNLINSSGLSIGTAYYIMKDITRELEDLYETVYLKEAGAAAQRSLSPDTPPAAEVEDDN